MDGGSRAESRVLRQAARRHGRAVPQRVDAGHGERKLARFRPMSRASARPTCP